MATDFSSLQGNWRDVIRQSFQQPNLTRGGAPTTLRSTAAGPGAPVHPAGQAPTIYDPSNMQMNLSMGGGGLGPDGAHGGHDAGAGAAAGPTGDSILDALLAAGPDWSDQMLMANKDKVSSVIDAAQATWGDARIMDTIQKNWMKAIYMALSGATGKPYYDKTGDGTMANLLYVPGYKPNAPAQIDTTNDPSHSWYT